MDFTSASEWETFTSKLEEILLSWQLSGKDREEEAYEKVQLNGPWKEVSENISFAGLAPRSHSFNCSDNKPYFNFCRIPFHVDSSLGGT